MEPSNHLITTYLELPISYSEDDVGIMFRIALLKVASNYARKRIWLDLSLNISQARIPCHGNKVGTGLCAQPWNTNLCRLGSGIGKKDGEDRECFRHCRQRQILAALWVTFKERLVHLEEIIHKRLGLWHSQDSWTQTNNLFPHSNRRRHLVTLKRIDPKTWMQEQN